MPQAGQIMLTQAYAEITTEAEIDEIQGQIHAHQVKMNNLVKKLSRLSMVHAEKDRERIRIEAEVVKQATQSLNMGVEVEAMRKIQERAAEAGRRRRAQEVCEEEGRSSVPSVIMESSGPSSSVGGGNVLEEELNDIKSQSEVPLSSSQVEVTTTPSPAAAIEVSIVMTKGRDRRLYVNVRQGIGISSQWLTRPSEAVWRDVVMQVDEGGLTSSCRLWSTIQPQHIERP